METLEHLRRRVETAEGLRSVVKTMQVLAAAGIRQYEHAATSLADYDRTVRLGLQALMRSVPTVRGRAEQQRVEDTALEHGEAGPVLGVAFGTDQGLCGQLNERVAERALSFLHHMRDMRDAPVLIASGHRLASLLDERGVEPIERLGTPGSLDGVGGTVSQILPAIMRHRQRIDRAVVYLIFPYRTSASTYAIRLRRILPMDQRWITGLRSKPWPTRCIPSWPGARRTTLSALVREYLFVSLFRAQVDALASEHASRLSSMQAAERNIEERLAELRGDHRQRRQTAITNQLMDVIAGFEALVAPGDR